MGFLTTILTLYLKKVFLSIIQGLFTMFFGHSNPLKVIYPLISSKKTRG
ncbi:hypothetical protein HMPREF1392_00770 [Helicobacter pylori GAM101Biv]|nr:hypothetical protein HMPREF1392_00770 [Helicobacter pylori GAM101Biv]